MTSLIKSNCLKKLKTLKFHSKQTYVFTNSNLIDLSLKVSPAVEYLEINAEHLDDSALQSLIKLGSATTTSAIIGSKNEINSIDNNGNQLQNDSHINLAAMRIKIPNNNVTTSSSTSSPSTALNREFVSSPQNTTPTTAIREYPSKKISPISTSVKTPPKVLQNLLMHNATLSNETLDLFSSGLSNIRELTLTNLHQSSYSNRIARLVTGGKKSISIAKTCIPKQIAPTSDFTEICKKLRKIELSSMDGFTDKDLAIIPANCRELQCKFKEQCYILRANSTV